MTLDEAIKYAEKEAEENQAIVDACYYYGDNIAKCEKCAKEHRQLAEWLKDYKRLKEQEPSDDCVSRKSLLDKLDPLYKEKIKTAPDNMAEGFLQVSNLIKYEPPVTPTQRWIPVSERLPEENGNYLAFYRESDGTATLEFMMVDHCNAGGGWLHEESGKKSYKKVIAWMLLPELYKAEIESKQK